MKTLRSMDSMTITTVMTIVDASASHEFEWKVPADTLQKMKDAKEKTTFKSPSFRRHSAKWHVEFSPMNKDENCGLYLNCDLFPDASNEIEVKYDLKVNEKTHGECSRTFTKEESGWGKATFMCMEKLRSMESMTIKSMIKPKEYEKNRTAMIEVQKQGGNFVSTQTLQSISQHVSYVNIL